MSSCCPGAPFTRRGSFSTGFHDALTALQTTSPFGPSCLVLLEGVHLWECAIHLATAIQIANEPFPLIVAAASTTTWTQCCKGQRAISAPMRQKKSWQRFDPICAAQTQAWSTLAKRCTTSCRPIPGSFFLTRVHPFSISSAHAV